MLHPFDLQFMRHALNLAQRGLGNVWPNPSVGAVIVKDGRVVGNGHTARGGRPHAETQAIAMAGADAAGATLYVTLEPCSHTGKTPPCAKAIIASGITRVVAACGDNNPAVAGKGFAMLHEAGIEVTENVLAAEARRLNAGFFSVIERNRPLVTVKMATSLDGRMNTITGESQWITSETARMRGHLLRATHDAILTGMGTVLADDPSLTCRLPGRDGDSPQRIVIDSQFRIPLNAKLLPAWVMTTESAFHNNKPKAQELLQHGSTVLIAPENGGKIDLEGALSLLAREGITRLLVEAGPSLSQALLTAGLADKLHWFHAPMFIGDSLALAKAPRFTHISTQPAGKDLLSAYSTKET